MLDGDPQTRKLSEARRGHARGIVHSILKDGALSTNAQRERGGRYSLTSSGGLPSYLHGVFVFPSAQRFERVPDTLPDGKRIFMQTDINGHLHTEIFSEGHAFRISVGSYGYLPEQLMKRVLYGTEGHILFSVFGVIAERAKEKFEQWTRESVQDRLRNSIAVVVPADQIPAEDYVPQNRPSRNDVLIKTSLNPSILLVPYSLRDDIGDIIDHSTSTVIYVGNRTEPLGEITDGNYIFPDYEGALRKLAEEIGKPLFVHGVRLPTNEDIAKGRVG